MYQSRGRAIFARGLPCSFEACEQSGDTCEKCEHVRDGVSRRGQAGADKLKLGIRCNDTGVANAIELQSLSLARESGRIGRASVWSVLGRARICARLGATRLRTVRGQGRCFLRIGTQCYRTL